MPNCNSQGRSSPDAHICHQQVGAEQGGRCCMLRVRTTESECPEDYLREVTEIATRTVRERERERTFPRKALT